MLRFFVEVAVAVGLSLFVATSQLGWTNYLVIASILAVIGAILIYSTHGLFRNIDAAPTLIWIVMTLGICVVLGILWPALPMIFFYERHKTKRWREKHELIVTEHKCPTDGKLCAACDFPDVIGTGHASKQAKR